MKLKLLSAGIFLVNFFAVAQNNAVTFKEYKKVFTTYPFSDPDPVPKPASAIYPYFRYDGFTDKPIQKEWKVVELENDFIKIMILPEVGGKIWSAVEKSTGKDFVYYNHVIKFRDIAMRGPWTSGGIEANYGTIGHTPACATAVDYTIVKKEDSSISVVIGVLDLLTGTPWRLDINLPGDKAYITTNSFWFNTTAMEQPYYTWMNTGIKASGNLQYIYPGTNYLGHEGEYGDWPINKKNGKDVSWYKNNNFGGYKSYHVFGKHTDFFGAYWHDDNFGMGRFSTYDNKPGKKIWIWGLSQQGMIWEKILTDKDGQYSEVQSGRLYNQTAEKSTFTPFKHKGFAPYATDVWTEYWFPVKQTKGFVKANNYGALNIKKENGWLKIYFSPLQNIKDELKVMEGENIVYSKTIQLKTMQPFADSVQLNPDEKNLTATLGETKLIYRSAPEADVMSRPLNTAVDFDWNTAQGFYLQAKENMDERNYAEAEIKMKQCLQKDGNYLPALTGMAMLMYHKLEYLQAVDYAKKALSIDTYDAAANYYYGLINVKLNKITDAEDGFEIAASAVAFRSAVYTELAKIYLRSGDMNNATGYAEKCLLNNQYNMEGLQLLAIIYRLQKDAAAATTILNRMIAVDPLNHFAGFEKYLWDNTTASKEKFTALIQSELPQQTYLELGVWYHQINCDEDALKVFSLAPNIAEIIYWKAFLQKQKADLSNINTGTDFPFRAETAAVLEALIKADNNWLLKYHLGLIEWSRNNLLRAKVLFTECGTKPADENFYAARAALMRDEPAMALADMQQAIKLKPQQWRFYKQLTEHFISQKQFEKALAVTAPFYKDHPDNYIMGMLFAKTLLLNKKYATADALLTKLNILPFEGATEGRHLYHEAKLMQAVNEIKNGQYKKALTFIAAAKLWPANLGVGKPYDEDIDERLEDWLNYICYTKMNEQSSAELMLKKIIVFTPRVENTVMNFLPANNLVTAWAIEKTSSAEKAKEWLTQQVALYPQNKIIQWSLQQYDKQQGFNLAADEKDAEVRILEQLEN